MAGARDIDNTVCRENNFRNSLWFSTENSASLAFRPISEYNELMLSYQNESGPYHSWRQPDGRNSLKAITSGYKSVGKFQLWGEFSFNNIFDKGLRGNAIMFEVPEDMPYYVLDTASSRWNRQIYDMSLKLASPIVLNHLSFGIAAGYTSKVGAKQKDPRTETYVNDIYAVPSVSYRFLNDHILGISGVYRYNFERSLPTNNNYRIDQLVYTTRGLGEGSTAKIGGNDGLNEYYYTGHTYGGHIQYGYHGKFSLNAEAGATLKTVDVMHQVSLPKNMGATRQMAINANIKALWGDCNSNKFSAEAIYRMTDGIEKIQVRDDTPFQQKWVVVSKNTMSTYTSTSISAKYDHQFGASSQRGYDWITGGEIGYRSEDDSYLSPESYFSWSNAMASVFCGRQLKFRNSELLIKLNGGYLLNLSGEYIYTGGNKTATIQEFWQEDLNYRKASAIEAGGRIAYTLHIGKVNYVFDLCSDFYTGYRFTTAFKFGIIF